MWVDGHDLGQVSYRFLEAESLNSDKADPASRRINGDVEATHYETTPEVWRTYLYITTAFVGRKD